MSQSAPPGLDALAAVDTIMVRQGVELLEMFTGFETNNKYTINDSGGQKIYYAVENTDCCTRFFCGARRKFSINIMDVSGNEVIYLHRPFRYDCGCMPFCMQELTAFAPPGTVVGFVKQKFSCCLPRFVILDENKEVVLRIKGPFCRISCLCRAVEFVVLSKDGAEQVGKISKQWSGLAREAFTDADFFGITFPKELDVKIKAVMLGACFLIDFMYFEK